LTLFKPDDWLYISALSRKNPINLQPMIRSANLQKYNKVEFDGSGGWKTWNNQTISQAYKERLRDTQDQIVELIRKAKSGQL
jgi:hypothetical protein